VLHYFTDDQLISGTNGRDNEKHHSVNNTFAVTQNGEIIYRNKSSVAKLPSNIFLEVLYKKLEILF